MIVIRAKRAQGYHLAAGYVAAQFPHIVPEFPEIAGCHKATINVELELPLVVSAPDHRTRPIDYEYQGRACREVFEFLRIELEAPVGAARVGAWLYIPSGSPHRRTPRIHEVLAPKIDIPAECQCLIYIDRPFLGVYTRL